MTVLICIPCLKIGGTEVQTLRLVEALEASGHRCITVCYFEYDFSMVEQYRQTGSEVVCLSAYGRRPERQWQVAKFLWRGLKRVVRENKPDVIHVQYMAPGAIPIFILRQLGVKNIVATTHTDASIYNSVKLVRFVQRHLVRAFVCVSTKAEESFFGSGSLFDADRPFRRRNHFTIPNCLAPNRKSSSPTLSISTHQTSNIKHQTSIGVVSRLESIKGVDFVMPAFAEVLAKRPDCRLIIVGDGKLREQMREQQQQLKISDDKVEWVGSVAPANVGKYYNLMRVVWVPSRSEGFGLSAVEAMSHGCCVVASDAGGLNEVIDDQVDGMLFQSENSDDLAKQTLGLLGNQDLMQKIGTEAMKKAEQYSFDKYKTRIETLMLKIINSSFGSR